MIPFIDLQAQRKHLDRRIDDAIKKVLVHGNFIGGAEVYELERKLASFAKAKNCISCANGTDALQLVMTAEGVGPGDAVFVPAFTFVASGEVVPPTGAQLVLVDVDLDTFLIDPDSLKCAINDARHAGLRPRMVVAVDLFGLPADYDVLSRVTKQNEMILVADAAQSFGGLDKGRPVGSLADYTTTSFFPAKPLGCYGDGGAIFTEDNEKANIIRSLCAHGKGECKYDNVRIGRNSRLDTLQAAILLEKLSVFEEELEKRCKIAARYSDLLSRFVDVPRVRKGCQSAWAQYTVKLSSRDQVQQRCAGRGIPTVIYYPKPLHLQSGYSNLVGSGVSLNNSESLSQHVLSLPMHPYLSEKTQLHIVEVFSDVVQSINKL